MSNSKSVAQKKARKNNSTTLKFILDGIPNYVKISVGEYTSAKDLWSKLEKEYQSKRQYIQKNVEEKPTEDEKQETQQDSVINEGKDPPESSDCCTPKCNDEVEVLNLKDDIMFAFKDIVAGPEYYPFFKAYCETFCNLESNVKEALEKLENS